MRKLVILAAALAAFASLAAAAAADTTPPTVTPFPAPKLGPVFVAAQTVDATGSMQAQFAPGSSVVFRAYAVDSKTHKTVVAKDAKYFYVAIPNQPNVKLKYNPNASGAAGRLAWTGTWAIPATYPTGTVAFKVLVKTQSKRIGQFVQMPVATAMLTVTTTPQATLGGGPARDNRRRRHVELRHRALRGHRQRHPAGRSAQASRRLHADERLQARRAGRPPHLGLRPHIRRRAVDGQRRHRHVCDPGQVPGALNYGAHGATGAKVWFWSAPWIVPVGFPLGDMTIHITFKTDSGKTGTYDHVVTIIP